MKIARSLSGIRGVMVAVLALSPIVMAAQTEPGSTPANPSSPSSNPGSSPNQTTPGVRRETAPGDADGQNGGGGTDGQGMRDKIFLRKASQGGLAEVKLGQLAADKESGEDVKKFGQRMVTDHTALNETMKPFADSLGVMVPAKLNKMDQAEYDKLSGMAGEDFDKEYLAFMTTDHRKDLRDFHEEADVVHDPALKDAVLQGERVIARHKRMVERLDAAHGVPAK